MSERDFSGRFPGPGDGPAAPAVVEQGVDGLLEHPLLVVDDDLGCLEVEESLQPVIPVDDASVQIVEVRGREPPTIELDHGAEVRRDDGDRVEHHPERVGLALSEVRRDLQPLDGLQAARTLAVLDLVPEALGFDLGVHIGQQPLDGLGTHAAVEVVAEPLAERTVDVVVGHQLLHPKTLECGQDVVEVLGVAAGSLVDPLHVALRLALRGGQLSALRAFGLQLLEPVLELSEPLLDVVVSLGVDVALLRLHLGLDLGQRLVAAVLVDPGDHIGSEIDDPLEVLGRKVQEVPQARRNALEVPDVRDRRCELDVAHAVTPNLAARDLDTAALADDPLESHALVLAAVTLPVTRRAEDPFAEQTVLLRLQRAVVDGFGLLDLAVRPRADLIRGGKADPKLIEEVHVQHLKARLLAWLARHLVQQFVIPAGHSKSAPAGSRRLRSIPSSSAARNTSSSVSRSSISSPAAERTSTFRQRDCISLMSTLNDSGIPGSGMFSPLTIASYTLTRPSTSSDLIVRSSWRAYAAP